MSMKIKDIKGKKIAVMGLGLHGGGIGAVKFLAKHGAKLVVTDIKPSQELQKSTDKLKGLKIKFVLGQHRLEDFINADLVIKNPGVPNTSKYLLAAKEHHVPIETDMGLFFDWCPAPLIGVTGTKGKSTTASLIAAMLSRAFNDVFLGGNIRTSVLEILPNIDKESLVVLELSSWQLEGIKSHKKSPHIAVVTNIYPDHLNRYTSLKQYIQDKKIIFEFQNKDDFLVLNYDDPVVRNFTKEAKATVYFYSLSSLRQNQNNFLAQPKGQTGAFLVGKRIFFNQDKNEVCQSNDFSLRGKHNFSNLLAAISAAKIYGIPNKAIRQALHHFQTLSGRIESVTEKQGVRYINDTCATIPEATIAALKVLPKIQPVILIAGGAAKGLSFSKLAKVIVKRVKMLILFEGSATPQLEKRVRKEQEKQQRFFKIVPVATMAEAVKAAAAEAETKDIVLLSPACASFGLFQHEFDRGEQFIQEVQKLK